MNKIKLNIKKESLYLNEGGAVIGDICFSVDDWYFPEKDWDDFVIVLLKWLTKITALLNKNEAKTVEMSFIEGSFKIALTMKENYHCKVDFIEGEELDGTKEIIHKTITVPLNDLIDEILKGCKIIFQMSESKQLDLKKDFENLKESYNLLLQSRY